jgi:hypothetical protein
MTANDRRVPALALAGSTDPDPTASPSSSRTSRRLEPSADPCLRSRLYVGQPNRLAEAPSGCSVAQEHDAGAKRLALHQTQARDRGPLCEQSLAAPEHDWLLPSLAGSRRPALSVLDAEVPNEGDRVALGISDGG